MLKVTEAGKRHCHVVLVAVVNGVLIFDGTAWLNNGPYSLLMSYFNTVGKRKKRHLKP